MGQECLGRDAVVEAAGTGGNVWTIQSCQNSANKFCCAFFQLAGTEERVFIPPKCRQKVFIALFFSWREP